MMGNQTEIIELSKLATPRHPAFGEFLVSHRILDRYQLFRALQMQDRMPKARLGQCAVALGYVHRGAVEQLHVRFTQALASPGRAGARSTAEGNAELIDASLDAMATEAFVRAHEEEIVIEVDLAS
jgi:hypothetical protein